MWLGGRGLALVWSHLGSQARCSMERREGSLLQAHSQPPLPVLGRAPMGLPPGLPSAFLIPRLTTLRQQQMQEAQSTMAHSSASMRHESLLPGGMPAPPSLTHPTGSQGVTILLRVSAKRPFPELSSRHAPTRTHTGARTLTQIPRHQTPSRWEPSTRGCAP